MFYRMELPFPDNKIEIYSDGNDEYTSTLKDFYCETCITYGQLIKIKKSGRLVEKIKVKVFGGPSPRDIETTDIENFNGILRERIGRLVRKTKCFSKREWRQWCALQLFQFYWNFINKFKRGKTPAMLEDIEEKPWIWNNTTTLSK